MSTKKRQKLNTIKLSTTELMHVRDLMSVLLPSGLSSVSKQLAEIENRTAEEESLWIKVFDACAESGLVAGVSAPDHAVVVIGPSDIAVVPLQIEK